MGTEKPHSGKSNTVMAAVRQKIEAEGERIWRLDDFGDMPSSAVAQALSRLVRKGILQRESKGTYFRPRQTALGKSRPNPADLGKLARSGRNVFPAGLAAANLLGFTTQAAKTGEVSTSAGSLPRKLIGPTTVIHTRRPEAWATLSDEDASMLDFLRRGGRTSELSSEQTIRRTLSLCSQGDRYSRLFAVADTEPPRVRAILGAIGEELGRPEAEIERLRQSLNSLSRFDFGLLSGLAKSKDWQAKEPL